MSQIPYPEPIFPSSAFDFFFQSPISSSTPSTSPFDPTATPNHPAQVASLPSATNGVSHGTVSRCQVQPTAEAPVASQQIVDTVVSTRSESSEVEPEMSRKGKRKARDAEEVEELVPQPQTATGETCEYCHKILKDATTLKKHQGGKYCPAPKNNSFDCPHCSKSFYGRKDVLIRHLREVHKEDIPKRTRAKESYGKKPSRPADQSAPSTSLQYTYIAAPSSTLSQPPFYGYQTNGPLPVTSGSGSNVLNGTLGWPGQDLNGTQTVLPLQSASQYPSYSPGFVDPVIPYGIQYAEPQWQPTEHDFQQLYDSPAGHVNPNDFFGLDSTALTPPMWASSSSSRSTGGATTPNVAGPSTISTNQSSVAGSYSAGQFEGYQGQDYGYAGPAVPMDEMLYPGQTWNASPNSTPGFESPGYNLGPASSGQEPHYWASQEFFNLQGIADQERKRRRIN